MCVCVRETALLLRSVATWFSFFFVCSLCFSLASSLDSIFASVNYAADCAGGLCFESFWRMRSARSRTHTLTHTRVWKCM